MTSDNKVVPRPVGLISNISVLNIWRKTFCEERILAIIFTKNCTNFLKQTFIYYENNAVFMLSIAEQFI